MRIHLKYKTQAGGWKWYKNPDGTNFNFKSFKAADEAMKRRNATLKLKHTPYTSIRVDGRESRHSEDPNPAKPKKRTFLEFQGESIELK
jgi:hypothetical protein